MSPKNELSDINNSLIDISNEQKFEPRIKQNQIVILKNFAYLTFEALENDEEVEVFLSVLS